MEWELIRLETVTREVWSTYSVVLAIALAWGVLAVWAAPSLGAQHKRGVDPWQLPALIVLLWSLVDLYGAFDHTVTPAQHVLTVWRTSLSACSALIVGELAVGAVVLFGRVSLGRSPSHFQLNLGTVAGLAGVALVHLLHWLVVGIGCVDALRPPA